MSIKRFINTINKLIQLTNSQVRQPSYFWKHFCQSNLTMTGAGIIDFLTALLQNSKIYKQTQIFNLPNLTK